MTKILAAFSLLCCVIAIVKGRAVLPATPRLERTAKHDNELESALEATRGAESAHPADKRAVDSGYQAIFWPNGVVPYVYQDGLDASYVKSYYKAMQLWTKFTCIKFVERTNETEYIRLTEDTYCVANVGVNRVAKVNTVKLGPLCNNPGHAMHELGHVLGLWHEHQRPDRDDYISINWDNLEDTEDARREYTAKHEMEINSFGVPYDLASIMHYQDSFYAKEGKKAFDVIVDKPQCLSTVGQRITISPADFAQINELYKCPAIKVPSFCELLQIKNIKNENAISLSLAEEDNQWLTCRQGRCYQQTCQYEGDETSSSRKKRNSFVGIQEEMLKKCDDHKFIIDAIGYNKKGSKVKVGDHVTLKWNSKSKTKFLDCSQPSGVCSVKTCEQGEGSMTGVDCEQHVFKVIVPHKNDGDIVETYDRVQLLYPTTGQYLRCNGGDNGKTCVVGNENTQTDELTSSSDPTRDAMTFVMRKVKQS